ncbi:MAG: type II toxin-antitoxin system RelE/ParE family toxin [Candidatus Thiosymbion ectosymbiont of Robbea hypermnestra]|nr:type II toxin-antitoxin system RelE/ParE family toxin [Candidatus Thiosymbion ectosymbiont of Robbea hypermnestra]
MHQVHLKPQAVKDLRHLPQQEARRIADALERLEEDLSGDIKKLTNFTPEYRLRVGSYRILFEVEKQSYIVVYRILHRRKAYRKR